MSNHDGSELQSSYCPRILRVQSAPFRSPSMARGSLKDCGSIVSRRGTGPSGAISPNASQVGVRREGSGHCAWPGLCSRLTTAFSAVKFMPRAEVAELADALRSGRSEGSLMWVQVPPSAPGEQPALGAGCFFSWRTCARQPGSGGRGAMSAVPEPAAAGCNIGRVTHLYAARAWYN